MVRWVLFAYGYWTTDDTMVSTKVEPSSWQITFRGIMIAVPSILRTLPDYSCSMRSVNRLRYIITLCDILLPRSPRAEDNITISTWRASLTFTVIYMQQSSRSSCYIIIWNKCCEWHYGDRSPLRNQTLPVNSSLFGKTTVIKDVSVHRRRSRLEVDNESPISSTSGEKTMGTCGCRSDVRPLLRTIWDPLQLQFALCRISGGVQEQCDVDR